MSGGTLELNFSFPGAEDATIASIIQLSNSVFNWEPESRYASLEEWKKSLSDPASTIIYLVPQPDDGTSSIPPPVAFIFAHPRTHLEPLRDGSSQSLHIWLAGVLEEYRGRGCLDTMVNALVDLEEGRRRLRSESSSMQTMTICTNPDRFPSMWAWLRGRTRWVFEKEFDGGKVMFSLTGHVQ